MEKTSLCNECAQRFFSRAEICTAARDEECFICHGVLAALPSLVESALSQSHGFEWKTFSISSSFSRAMLMCEADVATNLLPGQYTSIKNSVNSKIAEKIAKASGKKNDQRAADAFFEFDFTAKKAAARPAQLYVHGHYVKLSRGFCQSRWHCSECGGRGAKAPAAGKNEGTACPSCSGSGMNYPSVEEEIGKILMPAFGAAGCTLHASGREDVDVRCLGNGRPFVMELASPKKRTADLRALEREFQKNENVRAIGLRFVHKNFIDSVCNSHFEKEYEAVVSADRALTAIDAKKITTLSGTALDQHTPTRVLARRTDMLRVRTVYKISAQAIEGGKLKLHILAEAGTYIKEFIHSDDGRTKPSVSSTLACRAACDSLDVVAIRDYFLETVKE